MAWGKLMEHPQIKLLLLTHRGGDHPHGSRVLAATRRDKDVSQEALADRLGVSRDVVANIEAGRRRVEVSDLILIGRALDVDPEVLFRRVMRW